MASDISITITSDPSAAVKGIEQVTKASQNMASEAKKANAEAAQGGSSAVSQVLSVSQSAQTSVGQTISAVGNLSADVKKLGGDASKIAGAFGQSVPIIGKIGSALSAVMSGPVGLISAAIAAAGAYIQKMIADAEARLARLKASAEARTSAAYDQLMQGRQEYQAALDTLAKVRELNAAAKQSPLKTDEVALLRQLAEQIGIRAKDVTATGISPYRLQEAEERLRANRASNASADYQQYLEATTNALRAAIQSSDLSDLRKNQLSKMSLFEQADFITRFAKSGLGQTAGEVQAYQQLYNIVKQLQEVRTSYNRDAMLGRDQAALNAEAVDSVKSGVAGRMEAAENRRRLQDKLAAASAKERAASESAAKAAQSEADRRQAAADSITKRLQEEIAVQQLITDNKKREAELLRQRIAMESALGRALTSDELASLESLAGTLYDLRNPAQPSSEPEAQEAAVQAASRTSARRAARSTPLDRLQRIGANVAGNVSSPEKVVLDRQLTVQEQIRNLVAASLSSASTDFVMRF